MPPREGCSHYIKIAPKIGVTTTAGGSMSNLAKLTRSRKNLLIGAGFATLLVALAVGQAVLDKTVAAQSTGMMAPRFEVDPLWPKPLPNHWVLGSTIGVFVDTDDHVWIIH